MGQEDTAMKTLFKALLTGMLAVALTGPAASAEEHPRFTQAELDQMLAPIALYPDALLSQILMAATYPVEVVQAARWSRANPHLKSEDAVRAVEPMDWDPSVKSLVAFPQILDRMDERIEWTGRLGDAFVAQELQVMDTIQHLRQRADAAGHLGSSPEMHVVRDGGHILIEPASPHLLHVPYYDPIIVYGRWWWPAHRPVSWAPWPGHYVRTTHVSAFVWGGAVVIRTGFFFGRFNWPHRQVIVVHPKPANVIVHRHARVIHSAPAPVQKPVRWKHDPRRRHGVTHPRVEKGNSKPVHSVKTGRVVHLDGFGHVLNPPRKAPQAPSLRTEVRPRGTDAGRHDRHAQGARAPLPGTRNAEARSEARRPAVRAQSDARDARHAAANKAVSAKTKVPSPGATALRPSLIAAPLNAGRRVSAGANNPSPDLTPLQPHGIAAPLSAGARTNARTSSSRPADVRLR
jgi:hypothetical protein